MRSIIDRMDWRLPCERFYFGTGSEVTVPDGEDKRPLDLCPDLLQHDTGFAWGHESAGPNNLVWPYLRMLFGMKRAQSGCTEKFTRRVSATLPERRTMTRSRIVAHVHMIDFQWLAEE